MAISKMLHTAALAKENVCLSLSGCGFLGCYHIGVMKCFERHGQELLKRTSRYAGCSGGALVCAMIICCPGEIDRCMELLIEVSEEVTKQTFGALTMNFGLIEVLEQILEKFLPENAHELCHDRLWISLTMLQPRKNVIMSNFKTRQNLLKSLLASCYIPVYMGSNEHAPEIDGVQYIDGGLTNNLIRFDDVDTITICPFESQDADICPKDASVFDWNMKLGNQIIKVNMSNVVRGAQALFPPRISVLEEYHRRGFLDAMKFLDENGLFERQKGTEV